MNTYPFSIARYWKPFFNERCLEDITATDIDGFINHTGDMDLSASRKNVVIKVGIKPLRWAFSKRYCRFPCGMER